MPVVLVHSIHDAATAQALSDSVDGTLSTPLCEEKLLGRYTIIVSAVDALVLRFEWAGNTADNTLGTPSPYSPYFPLSPTFCCSCICNYFFLF